MKLTQFLFIGLYLFFTVFTFILGIILLKRAFSRKTPLIEPPDKVLLDKHFFKYLEFDAPKVTTKRPFFRFWYLLLGTILIIGAIYMIIDFVKSELWLWG